MRISRVATIIAVSAIGALPALAQTTTNANTTQPSNRPASKQPTQGLPQSMANPQYGSGGDSAQKQQTQGLPSSLANPQYGGAYSTQKRQ
jgi:hypothetical protein